MTYLADATQPYGLQTIGDYTLITNPQKTVGTTGTTDTFNDNYAFVSINTVAYNAEYVVAIDGSDLTATTKYRAGALSVVKADSDPASSSWNTSDGKLKHAGKQEVFDEDTGIKFTVLVNGTSYVDFYNSEYQHDSWWTEE